MSFVFDYYYEPYSWDSSMFVQSAISWVVVPMLLLYFFTIGVLGIAYAPFWLALLVLLPEYMFVSLGVFCFGLAEPFTEKRIPLCEVKFPKTWHGIIWFLVIGLFVPLMFLALPLSRLRKFYSRKSSNFPYLHSDDMWLR